MDKTRRLHRIFAKDGKALVVAMDHGTNAGAVKGLERPASVIEAVAEGGADAIIANLGFAKAFAAELAPVGLILRLDIPPTAIGTGHDSRVVFGVEEALKLGADAVIVNGGPGDGEKDSYAAIAAAVKAAEGSGVPVIGEICPGGFDADPSLKTLDNLVLGARIACELGVDVIKIAYKSGFRAVVEGSFVPVLVLGGAKSDDQRGFLSSVREALDSGGSGVAIGRNVWGAPNPRSMAEALCSLIHRDADIDAAMRILNNH